MSHLHCFIWNAQGLTVANVQGLMGNQLRDLKVFENETVIQDWINMQTQSDLDSLGLGLTTTRTDSTTAPLSSNSTDSIVTTTLGKNPSFLCVMSDRRFYAHALEKIIYRNCNVEIVAAVQVNWSKWSLQMLESQKLQQLSALDTILFFVRNSLRTGEKYFLPSKVRPNNICSICKSILCTALWKINNRNKFIKSVTNRTKQMP